MGDLLTNVVTFPYAPVRLVTSIVKVLVRQAEQEMRSSTAVRRELEELDEALSAGEITEADYEKAQQAILERLTGQG